VRILRVAQTCYPDVTGGGAYHVHALSRDQAARGHDVTVLTVRREPGQPHVEERAGYAVVRFDPTVAPLGNELAVGAARYLHETDGYDVLHAHSHLYASTNLAALERRLGDAPLAITNHGLYSQTAPAGIFDAYLRTLGRWTFNQADVVFCYSGVDERRLRSVGVESDVAVVPNGVDTDRFTPDGPTSDRIDAGGPTVLFVGRLVEGKRPADAIAAVRRLRAERPDVTLYVCGDGPLRGELEARRSGDRAGDDRSGADPPDDAPPVRGPSATETREAADTAAESPAFRASVAAALAVDPPTADSSAADWPIADPPADETAVDTSSSSGSASHSSAGDASATHAAAGDASARDARTGGAQATDGVVFLGRVPYDEMPAIYRSADALVLPSRAEGLPRTVLEAMASGTPVVTSDLPHVRPVATNCGRTAPVGDVPAFADGLESILEDPPEGGPEYVRRNHRWADCVDATTDVLELRSRGHAT